ncbi:DedA family protein [Actinomadura craniellae]|uniref:DedA family protein n=1 Tax=Actinomadura craniellae TaxID=2231787 RepID=A0A365GVX6_9ACTN|nr:VTT domain-containing protein [Actinomadura craniellae]RAY10924.1 DedA family protein [Actinomadura craniellae]
MKYGLQDPRLWWSLGVLFLYTVARAQTLYWVGRGMGLGFHSSPLGRRVGRERMERIERAIHSRGSVVLLVAAFIPFVRIGVWGAAGVTRLPFARFVLFGTLGAALYSVVLGLGGYALLVAWLELAERSPVLAGALPVAVAGLVILLIRRRRRAEPLTPDHAAGRPRSRAPRR